MRSSGTPSAPKVVDMGGDFLSVGQRRRPGHGTSARQRSGMTAGDDEATAVPAASAVLARNRHLGAPSRELQRESSRNPRGPGALRACAVGRRRVRCGADVRRPGCRSPVVGAGTRRTHPPSDPRGRGPRLGEDHDAPAARERGTGRRGRPPAGRLDPVLSGAPARRSARAVGASPTNCSRSASRPTPPTTTRRAVPSPPPCAPRPQRSVADDTLVMLDDADVDGDRPAAGLPRGARHAPAAPAAPRARCRRPPPLRLARLRAAGEVARFTEEDLAIGPAEIDGLGARRRMPAVAAIATATGGWPLAVRLAAEVAARGGPLDHDAIVDRLLDREGVLFEYLAEEVLSSATDGERELLALAAHVPFVDGPLLAWIGRDELARLLPLLGRAGLFLERDPASPDRYRATLVGGEFARRALPPPPAELVRRILTSLCERGDAEQALETCLRLGEPAVAREVVLAIDRPDLLGRVLDDAVALAASGGDDAGSPSCAATSTTCAARGTTPARRTPRPPRSATRRSPAWPGSGPRSCTCAAASTRPTPTCAARPPGRHGPRRGVEGPVVARRRAVDARRRRRLPSVPRAGARARRPRPATTPRWRPSTRRGRCSPPSSATATRTPTPTGSPCATPSGPATSCRSCASTRTAAATTWRRATTTPRSRELDAAIELAELIGSDNFGALAYSNRGDTYCRLGRLDDALDDLRRAEAIWQRLGSGIVHYAVGLLGDVQALRGPAQRGDRPLPPGDRARRRPARHPGARARADRPGPDAGRRRPGGGGGGRGAGDRHGPVDVDGALPTSPPAGSSCAAATATPPPRSAALAAAVRPGPPGPLGGRRGPAAAGVDVSDPPDAAVAEESRRLARDLGDPIGEARAALAVARSLDRAGARGGGRRRRAAARRRRRMGRARRGPRARVRRPEAARRGHRDARRVPRQPRRRAGRARRVGLAQGPRPAEAAGRAPRRAGRARGGRRAAVARRARPLGPAAVGAAQHDPRGARPRQGDAARPLRRRRPRHGLARPRARRDRRRAVPARCRRGPPAPRRRRRRGRRAGAGTAPLPATSASSAPTTRTPTGRRARASWRGTRSSSWPASSPASPTTRTEHGDAVRHRLRILDVDPYDEDAHLDMIRSLTAQRRHGEARRAYRTYCTRLAELELEPAPFP